MADKHIKILMNGVTGRMGRNQHLVRSILSIAADGGVRVNDETIIPEPVLIGRDSEKLSALAQEHGIGEWTTDLDSALQMTDAPIFFDSASTSLRAGLLKKAILSGKHVYCEKPVAQDSQSAYALAKLADEHSVKHGVVQDKLWLTGVRRLRDVIRSGALGKIHCVKIDFGYWVFDGSKTQAQRPSWNYRKKDGGGMILDMMPHWHYLITNLFGTPKRLVCVGAIHVPRRWDEHGNPYQTTAEDAAYAIVELQDSTIVHISNSWCTRVRRDDLVVIQVDGASGSAFAGLTDLRVQLEQDTPRPFWNPDQKQSRDFYDDWHMIDDSIVHENAFKAQWIEFLKHVYGDNPFPWNLESGANGVRFAEEAEASWVDRSWRDL